MRKAVLTTIGFIACLSFYAGGQSKVSATEGKTESGEISYAAGNEYQRDLLYFFDILESTHPAFAKNSASASPFDIAAAIGEGYAWASECESKEELWGYLQRVATKLNDGHTTLIPDFENSPRYPLSFTKYDGAYRLTAVSIEYEMHLGKEIVMINDTPVKDVMDSFKSLISVESNARFDKMIEGNFPFASYWKYIPCAREDSLLKITFGDGHSIELEAANRKDLNIKRLILHNENSSPMNRQNTPFRYQIIDEEGICYLQFNTCQDQSTIRTMFANDSRGLTPEEIEKAVSKYPRFDEFLEEMFGEIARNGINTLVVDVRLNAGGNSTLCNILLSWLKPTDQIREGVAELRPSALWKQRYPSQAERYASLELDPDTLYIISELEARLKGGERPKRQREENENPLFRYNRDESRIFGGDVIFIQSESTYSSAGLLITDAVDNKIGIVIGSESTFRPTHYGDALFWTLPETGLTGVVSHKIFHRPDESKDSEPAIRPDVDIPYTWYDYVNGHDVYWEWIVSNYGQAGR